MAPDPPMFERARSGSSCDAFTGEIIEYESWRVGIPVFEHNHSQTRWFTPQSFMKNALVIECG